MEISLCMIVRNEESVIGKCLDSVKDIADEIVIADTGSTDRTKEICRGYTDKIFDFRWIDDFAAARNFSFSKAEKEYILWLDADDVLLEPDRQKLLALKASADPALDVVMLKYNFGFDDQGRCILSFFRERIVRRSRGFVWREPVHEYIEGGGNALYADISVTHQHKGGKASERNLRIYEKQLAEGRALSPRGQYYYARELRDHGRGAEAIGRFRAFLDGGAGWVEDNINACVLLSECCLAQRDGAGALKAALRALEYDMPRPAVACAIGAALMERGSYSMSEYWYKLAMALPKPENEQGFVYHDYTGFIPCLQLCVCYDRLGRHAEAIAYNEAAARFKPGDAAVEYNRQYFAGLSGNG